MKKQILIVAVTALTAIVILSGTSAQYQVGGFAIRPLQIIGVATLQRAAAGEQATHNGDAECVPCIPIAVSPIRDSNVSMFQGSDRSIGG